MATESVSEAPALFLRNATGLVRGWTVRDSVIYAVLATNFVTLAIYEFAFAAPAFPQGQLITSVVISGIWVSFLVIAYAGLVVTIPRAGGDYVWQTRILGSGLGFVMAATGWWFILWLWAPIYGNILAVQFFQPHLGDAEVDLASRRGRLVRHAQRDIRRLDDYHRDRRAPGVDRHGGLRQVPEVVLLRRPGRLRSDRRAPAYQ